MILRAAVRRQLTAIGHGGIRGLNLSDCESSSKTTQLKRGDCLYIKSNGSWRHDIITVYRAVERVCRLPCLRALKKAKSTRDSEYMQAVNTAVSSMTL